ncbi:hypothetical protein V6N00_02050 [Tersicoccus sp. MR15.9]|uniref:hypothetical protein n=1 Tax=Tersicoccus mangrovi TaxID=3121635 RepID=UPI002FE5F126
MGFFPPDEVIDDGQRPDPQQPAWWGPPDDEIPMTWASPAMLGVTDHVAVALIGAEVFSDGVILRIERRLRRLTMPRQTWSRHREVFLGHDAEDAPGRLRYGLVLDDGRNVFDSGPAAGSADPFLTPSSSVLTRQGGGGSGDDRSFSTTDRLWLWPLPPAGPLDLVFQWPDLGLDESHTALDGSAIVALSSRAVALWPHG